ncbi:MAG: GNAT family N-acetyltransferase [Tissierellia bacterium]|nr:GNAT family protein [Bacillota bacterium]NLL23556.1 GNAT family N-acetyltransferase [Tissierellia bacterium]
MSRIYLELLSEEHADALYRFENDNRGTFDEESYSRHSSYYERSTFQSILEELIEEQGQQLHAMYLVFIDEGTLIGRVNLMRLMKEPFVKAEIGYRIAPPFQGKGHATEAVRLLLEKAKKIYSLHRVEARISVENAAACKVLEKNGFRHVGTYEKYIRFADEWIDSHLFEIVLD